MSNEISVTEETAVINTNVQVVISNNTNKFILFKKFRDGVSCVVPYYKYEDEDFGCEFVIPNRNNKLKRIQNAYSMVESIGSYTVTTNTVGFDCLENFPDGVFNSGNNEGWIHFNQNTITDGRATVVQIDDRIVIEKTPDNIMDTGKFDLEFEQKFKIKYKPMGVKVFPVVFDDGFCIVITNESRNTATMYLSLSDVSKMFVGTTTREEVYDIIKNVMLFFPFFNCGINENVANVYLKNIGGLKPFLTRSCEKSCLLKFSYVFSNTDVCLCQVIGQGNIS
jgi:hypothetical protein